ncbi:pyridoxamine 5'-phosphate oxidase [Ruficoccus amylovorans]|uniref:Pyridoxamine 5'-phosphate oxidase n=1 Tax=Ruficoccus amylovorans TaxID=1804625 RepID=A0A842HFI6_9BACT|nr:pyridoxamine 5'-phosphate oxidase [Ruficoccus amylovorans]MBC2594284.1 pyridoxamine 5'-phosphate oxidase [Ruficoccus amylovorans]
MNLADMRRNYTRNGLSEESAEADPFAQFRVWFEQALQAELAEPNAMTLGTAGADGQPNLRTVLLKAYDAKGFVFYTNYTSAKATEIAENPQVCLLFTWLDLERQIKIQGRAEKISAAESLRYFASRPFGSRLGAWVSHQSRIISSRKLLEMKLEEVKRKFAGGEIPLPSFWGGYRVKPIRFEFWQGRENRLHDRLQYSPSGDGDNWKIERLAP